eukprot:TRINITY_DN17200_c0_g1_i2.p1 TRINITY_DN17200_c0_g1~~TRINITY_DN17200_c0_g1_i2.p1  ORF type:complete len:451 (-),score=31.42 TRINITY_DN17200_c0_g1_i2:1128-2423(-)
MSLLGDTETDGWSHADIVSSRSAFHGPAPISSRERHGAETLSDVVSSSGSLQHAIGRTVNLQRFSVFPKRPDMVRRLYRTASQTLTSFTETMPQTLRRFRTEVAMAEKLIMSITDHVRLPMIIELEEQLFGDDSFLRDLETEAARSLKVYKEHVEGGLQHQLMGALSWIRIRKGIHETLKSAFWLPSTYLRMSFRCCLMVACMVPIHKGLSKLTLVSASAPSLETVDSTPRDIPDWWNWLATCPANPWRWLCRPTGAATEMSLPRAFHSSFQKQLVLFTTVFLSSGFLADYIIDWISGGSGSSENLGDHLMKQEQEVERMVCLFTDFKFKVERALSKLQAFRRDHHRHLTHLIKQAGVRGDVNWYSANTYPGGGVGNLQAVSGEAVLPPQQLAKIVEFATEVLNSAKTEADSSESDLASTWSLYLPTRASH